MNNQEMYDAIDNNGLNMGDKCTVCLIDGRVLIAEFIEYIDFYLRVKVQLNKRPYITKANEQVEMWQVEIQNLKIPVEEIKYIEYIL
jgi:hypothetical protein